MAGPTLADLRREYARADSFCQEVQGFINEAGIPAINELRNAGHHLLNALDDGGGIADDNELRNAISHARRACYEASEAGILMALAIVAKFKSDYASVAVSPVLPDYIDVLRLCDSSRQMIERERDIAFDREADHTARMTLFRELRGHCVRLDIAREELNKAIDTAVQLRRRFIIQISTTALCIAISIVLAAVGWWFIAGR